MGQVGDLIQAYKDENEYQVSDAAIGRKLGVSRSSVGNWAAGSAFPKAENIKELAQLLGVSYTRLLDAALADAGYLPKEREGRELSSAANAAAVGDPDGERIRRTTGHGVGPGEPAPAAPALKPPARRRAGTNR